MRLLVEKIPPISLKLNFIPNTLGYNGFKTFVQEVKGQRQRDWSVTECGQLYHVTTWSIGSQPISEGKTWIPTNQICGIQKDR